MDVRHHISTPGSSKLSRLCTRSHLPITAVMALIQDNFRPSTSSPICEGQTTTKSRAKSPDMSTMATLTEHYEQPPILTIPSALLGHYTEKYGPQSAVASCNPSDISTRESLDFSLDSRLTVIHLSSQRCCLDCRDHPGGPLARKGDVPTHDQPCNSICRPEPHHHQTPAHMRYITIAHVLSKKTFQTVSTCPTVYPFKLSTRSS